MKKKIFPNKKDLKVPIVWAFIIMILYFLLNLMLDPKKITIDLASVCVDFGITFAAFSITALSLLPLLQTKEWYVVFVKTSIFDDIVVNYRESIWMNIYLIFWGIFVKVISQACNEWGILAYNSLCIFFIVFIAIFLYRNVQSLIELLLKKKN